MLLDLVLFGVSLIYAIEMVEVVSQSKSFFYATILSSSGVFLIPYIIFLFLLGIPLFFLEVNLGQFTSQGAVQCWRMAPIFKGHFFGQIKIPIAQSKVFLQVLGFQWPSCHFS